MRYSCSRLCCLLTKHLFHSLSVLPELSFYLRLPHTWWNNAFLNALVSRGQPRDTFQLYEICRCYLGFYEADFSLSSFPLFLFVRLEVEQPPPPSDAKQWWWKSKAEGWQRVKRRSCNADDIRVVVPAQEVMFLRKLNLLRYELRLGFSCSVQLNATFSDEKAWNSGSSIDQGYEGSPGIEPDPDPGWHS